MTPVPPAATLPGVTEPAATRTTDAPDDTQTPALPPNPEITADPLAVCPREEPGKRLFTSEINGFCFLYPDGFTIQPDELRPDAVVKLVGPREEAGPKQQEVAIVTLWVANNGPADVADSAAYAQKWRELNIRPGDPSEIYQETTMIGGYPAEALDWLPGMFREKTGFVVANDNKYTVAISPSPGFVNDLDEQVNQTWQSVADTIRFFPPLVQRDISRASEVCPQAGPGTKLFVQEAEGYCFLYPENFMVNPSFAGRIEGGPNLGNWEGFENVHVAFSVGSYPILPGDPARTPRDILAQRVNVDSSSIQDRTIGGARAVVIEDNPQGGPWASRQAIIVNGDGRVYTIVNDPWEPERWPESTAAFESVWQTAVESLTFFTPWH